MLKALAKIIKQIHNSCKYRTTECLLAVRGGRVCRSGTVLHQCMMQTLFPKHWTSSHVFLS